MSLRYLKKRFSPAAHNAVICMSDRWVLLGSLRWLTYPLLRFAGAGVIPSVILFSLTRSGVFWRVSILAANGRQTFYGQLTFCTRRKGPPPPRTHRSSSAPITYSHSFNYIFAHTQH